MLSVNNALKNLNFLTKASLYYSTAVYYRTKKTPNWVRGNDYYYWMMDADEDRKASVFVFGYSDIYSQRVYEYEGWRAGAIQLVINLKKEALQTNTQQPSNS